MASTRRYALLAMAASGAFGLAQSDNPAIPSPSKPDDDEPTLPNGKHMNDAIAKKRHSDAVHEADELVTLAEQIRDELKKAGDYTVPLPLVKKTEDIEKLARKIKRQLKY